MKEPDTALEAYQMIIDHLVEESRTTGYGVFVSSKGIFSNCPDHQKFNEFVTSLTPHQRQLISEMLQEERDGTIHDVLALLTWWITTRDVGLTFRGETMPNELSGMGLHGDFVGRKDGWNWPTS
jgi:hypothetical protein